MENNHLITIGPLSDLPLLDPRDCNCDANLIDLELTAFLSHLILDSNSNSSERVVSPRLSQKIHWIKQDPSQLNLISFDEKNTLEFQISTFINDCGKLSDKEKVFCSTIINQYFLTPGYKTYQSFCCSLWQTLNSEINLATIKEVTDQIKDKIDKVKEANEERASYFESVYHASLPIAITLHRRLLEEVAKEKPPCFLKKTLQVECSFDQFEFALFEAERELSGLFSQAENNIGTIYITKLFQIILCGENVILEPFQTNPVCFLIRESKVKKKPACPISLLEEGIGILDSGFPVKGTHFSISLDSTVEIPSFELWVSWMTPKKSIEHLLSYLIEPDSKPHTFTHPLTGPNLNAFADQCVLLFPGFLESCLEDHTVMISFDKFLSKEKADRIHSIKENQTTISKRHAEACRCYPSEERGSPSTFLTSFLALYTCSNSIEELKTGLRDLMKNREFKDEFLKKILALIKSHPDELLFLAKHHQRYRKSYEAARAKAIKLHHTVRLAFSNEDAPTINHRTGLIEVSYERFWAVFSLFNKSYQWMIELASSQGDLALANHFLSLLLCGKDAENLLPVQRLNSHCFSIRDFNHAPRCIKEDIDLKGLSYNHRLFNQMERSDNNASVKDQFVLNFKKACSLFIFDAIERNNYRVSFDKEDLMSRELHFIPTLLERYLRYLQRNRDELHRIRKTAFYSLIREHLSQEMLCDALLVKNRSPLAAQIIDQIFFFLRDVPEDMRDLIYLKLIELMCALNQQIFLDTSGTMCGKLTEALMEKKFPYILVPGFEFDYGFCFTSHLDAITCEGTILLCMIGEPPNSIFEKVFPAQMGARMTIPSFTDSDLCPVIELTQFRFNALSTLPFCEFVACQMNDDLEKQVAQNWSLNQILMKYQQIKEEAETLFNRIKDSNFENTDSIKQIERLFQDLFDIQNKLNLLLSIHENNKELKNKILSIEIKSVLKVLNKIFAELNKKRPNAARKLYTQIKRWFP